MAFTRKETARFYKRTTSKGVVMLLTDLTLLGLFTCLALWSPHWWLQLPFSLLAGTMIAPIFVIGHDAAHDSLTPSKRLNRLIGRIAFLPSLHPYSLWVVLHNLRHHRWTTLATKDDVWTPCDLAAYQALPWRSRLAYRFYRTPLGPVFYYLIEFWCKKFTWPYKKHYGKLRRRFVTDTLLVHAFAAGYVALLVFGAGAGWFGGVRPWWDPVLFGAVLPFLVWNAYHGMSIYLQHTHPRLVWYNDQDEWRQVSKAHTTVHAVFPRVMQRFFHFIMEHNVHHLRPAVPLYHLQEAQARLEAEDNGRMVVYRWTWSYHGEICRRCKLYDFDAKRWMDFEGNYTSKPLKEITTNGEVTG